jgi:HlyD family secretion protein
MKRSRRTSLIVTFFLLAAAGYGSYWYFTKPKKVTFLTAQVTRGTIESAISATGTLEPVLKVPVGSRVSGNVLEMYADYNTPVKKGQLIALIDPEQFQTQLQQAEAQLRSARTQIINAEVAARRYDLDVANAELSVTNQKATVARTKSQLDEAKRKLDLQQRMFEQGLVSKDSVAALQASYDQAVLSMESAEASLKTALANLESVKAQRETVLNQKVTAEAQVTQAENAKRNAELNLEYTRILAPVDGVVIARNMSPGQTVQASMSAPQLFEIAQDLTKMQLWTNIDESDISRVREGLEATFTVDAFPGQNFRGEIIQIRRAPQNVSNVITYTVVITVDNPDLRLFPGMTANTRIVTERAENALRIPSAALRFRAPDELLDPEAKGKNKGGKGDFKSGFKGDKGDVKQTDSKDGETKGPEFFSQLKDGDREELINQFKAKGFDPSQFQGRGGGGRGGRGGKGGGGGGRRPAAGLTVQTQTVYIKNAKGLLEPIRVRTGITDGSWVALLGNNLQEGQELITGVEGLAVPANKQTNAPGFPGGGGNFKNKGGFFF